MRGVIFLNRIKVFFLPHAGGSAASYLSWKKYFNEEIDLIPIEMRGKGRRFNEPMYKNMEEAVDDLSDFTSGLITDSEYAFFGHSMGTVLAYELSKKLISLGFKAPKHVFFSGKNAPNFKSNIVDYHLPDDQFLEKMHSLGGIDKKLFENEEIRQIFLPILRNDIMITEGYNFVDDGFKLNCDISILFGSKDKLTYREGLEDWRNISSRDCSFYEFDDGHFFTNKYNQEISGLIKRVLNI